MEAGRWRAGKPYLSAHATLYRIGFRSEGLRIAKAVGLGESDGFTDAVGDLDRTDDKWGPSIGWFQIRSLRDPLSGNVADRYRYAWALRHPDYNAAAAFAISKGGLDWSPWSVYRSGRYLELLDTDYPLRTGHPRAEEWDA